MLELQLQPSLRGAMCALGFSPTSYERRTVLDRRQQQQQM